MNRVSVIIPTYDRAGTLIKAINSVLNQGPLVEEVLVCDDGSTDNSKEIVASLSDPRVKWIDCGRWGRPAGPRNIGARMATADYLAFLDSDDEWLPGKVEAQVQALLTGVMAVCSNALRIRESEVLGNYFQSVPSRLTFNELLRTNFVICSSMLVRRDLFLQCGGFPEQEELRALEDYALWLRISTLTSIAYIAQPFVRYRDAPAQSIRRDDVGPVEQKSRVLEDLIGWLSARSDSEEYISMVRSTLRNNPMPWHKRLWRRLSS